MKIRVLLPVLTLALALPLGLRAADDEPQTELGSKMEKLSGAFRALRRQIDDASKNADSLAKVATIKENAMAASKFEPALKAKKPESEQAKFVASFQAKMKDFIGMIDKLEAALKANNNAEASKIAAQMNDTQKEAHSEFKAKGGKKKG